MLMLRSSSVTDHLFEVAVEVNFSQDADESWDQLARSLLLSVKSLVSLSRQRKDRKSFPQVFSSTWRVSPCFCFYGLKSGPNSKQFFFPVSPMRRTLTKQGLEIRQTRL